MVDSKRDPTDMSSMLLVQRDTIFDKSDAVIQIMRGLNSPILRILAFLVKLFPRFLRDGAYEWVAANRYRMMGT